MIPGWRSLMILPRLSEGSLPVHVGLAGLCLSTCWSVERRVGRSAYPYFHDSGGSGAAEVGALFSVMTGARPHDFIDAQTDTSSDRPLHAASQCYVPDLPVLPFP